jgi:hypothetical protein
MVAMATQPSSNGGSCPPQLGVGDPFQPVAPLHLQGYCCRPLFCRFLKPVIEGAHYPCWEYSGIGAKTVHIEGATLCTLAGLPPLTWD